MLESNVTLYAIALIQVLVTLVWVPEKIKAKLQSQLSPQLAKQHPELGELLQNELNLAIKSFIRISRILAVLGAGIVSHAWVNNSELLNWDNQAGLVILAILAAIAILVIGLGLNRCRRLSLKLDRGIRQTSLAVRSWQSYLSPHLVMLVISAQVAALGTVGYFSINPFDGFTAQGTLLGVVALNAIFSFGMFKQVTENNWPTGVDEALKQLSRQRGVTLTLWVWAMATTYLCLSLWLSGLELKQLDLIGQSLYMMLVLIIGSRFFDLPQGMSRSE